MRPEYMHSYNYRPRLVFFHEDDENRPRTRFYGIELEVNGSSAHADAVDARLSEHAYLKEDGSLDPGFEIVTQPHSFRAMRKLWTEYFQNPAPGLLAYKSGQCGLHIHIGRSTLTDAQIRRMVVFINAPENTAFIEQIAQRSHSQYSRIKPKKLTDRLYNEDRYEALNLQNAATVELRIFRGSYRLDRVLKALDFADALVEFTTDRSYRELTVKDFTAFLKTNSKKYKWLWSFLTGDPVKTSKEPTTAIQSSTEG